ncbi:MAG: NAD(P)-dependent oxidoreductase [Pseudomonadota bacterium]
MHIGIIGTGRMGAAIGQRLLDCGHTLQVWNRSVDKTAPLRERGATVAATPAALVQASELVISILTDAAAIEAAFGGADGVLSVPLDGKLFVEMSTVRPHTEVELAARVAARGGAMVECPVGGTVGPAREGKLLGMVGGADADVARARPVLEQMCRRVEHVGPNGAGASLKLAINLPLLVFWQSFGEALALAAPLKLDPARLLDIFGETSGAPNALRLRTPVLAEVLAGKPPGGTQFNVDAIRKDLRTMIEEAQGLGYGTLPVTAAALGCFDRASQSGGLGDADSTQLPSWWVENGKG